MGTLGSQYKGKFIRNCRFLIKMPKCRLCNQNNSIEELHTICHKSDNHSIWCTDCIKDIIEKAQNKENIILTCQLCNSENILNYEVESNLEKSVNYQYVNGKLHGENVKIYYDNMCTKVKSIGNYNNGILYGKYNEYDENGNLHILCEYTNEGLLDGIYSKYVNGKIDYEITYEVGIKNGAKTYYYNNYEDINDELNGRIQKIEFYKEDMLNSFVTKYDVKHRVPLYEVEYKNNLKDGKSIIYEYSTSEAGENGEYKLVNKIESIYKNNNLYNGEEKYYYDNNNKKMKSHITCVNGIKHEKNYYENGKIKSEKNYENEVLHGIVKDYDINGNVIVEEFYNNGKLDGAVIKHIYKESIKNISISGVKKMEKKIDLNKSYSYSELLKSDLFLSKEVKQEEHQKRRPRDVEIFRKNQFSDFGSVLTDENEIKENKEQIEEQFSTSNFSEHKNMMNDEDPFIRKIKEFSFM